LEFKEILNYITAKLKKLKNIKIKKFNWGEIAATAIIIVIVGVIIIPSVGKCIGNGRKNKCSSRMYLLLNQLSEHLTQELQGGEWHDMILNGNSSEALEILADEVKEKRGWKINSDDYYFETKGNELVLRCKKHKEITDKTLLITNVKTEEKEWGTFGWNSNAEREIKDIRTLGDDALIIDAGAAGKYCLAAWSWADYVEETEAEGDKEYGASIVLYDGKYYYYPDGFRIRKGAENSNPFKYAEDLEDSNEGAYCIPFDTDSISDARFSPDNHEGSLMIEDGAVYIWQAQPSRELSKGWIKVYCQYKKL
jgi:hypothetical protein